jgi:hypothetical protein
MKNIAMDIGFTIETDKEFEDLTQAEVLGALLRRIDSLLQCWEKDAIGYSDEYEVTPEPIPKLFLCPECDITELDFTKSGDLKCPVCNYWIARN